MMNEWMDMMIWYNKWMNDLNDDDDWWIIIKYEWMNNWLNEWIWINEWINE